METREQEEIRVKVAPDSVAMLKRDANRRWRCIAGMTRFLVLLLLVGACQPHGSPATEAAAPTAAPAAVPPAEAFPIKHPAWAATATSYQVNVRQYTLEGTFRAFEAHLPRLQRLGVGIRWLLPINPIGLSHRKGRPTTRPVSSRPAPPYPRASP